MSNERNWRVAADNFYRIGRHMADIEDAIEAIRTAVSDVGATNNLFRIRAAGNKIGEIASRMLRDV